MNEHRLECDDICQMKKINMNKSVDWKEIENKREIKLLKRNQSIHEKFKENLNNCF
jgi:hypothetical protein